MGRRGGDGIMSGLGVEKVEESSAWNLSILASIGRRVRLRSNDQATISSESLQQNRASDNSWSDLGICLI